MAMCLDKGHTRLFKQICSLDTSTSKLFEGIMAFPFWFSICLDMWNAPVVQSRQPLTYRLMESVGLGGTK